MTENGFTVSTCGVAPRTERIIAGMRQSHAISSRLRLNPEYFPDILEHLDD